VSLNDWILALHVLSAFAYMGAIVLFWVLVVAVRRTDDPQETVAMEPIARVGTIAVAIGGMGTLILGIWLAISKDEYQLWDGWVLAAFVLWALSAAFGQRTGTAYMQGTNKARALLASGQHGPSPELSTLNRTANGVLFHSLTTAVVLLILIDMIWKPGA
jgi:uncharacterized membrane protein